MTEIIKKSLIMAIAILFIATLFVSLVGMSIGQEPDPDDNIGDEYDDSAMTGNGEYNVTLLIQDKKSNNGVADVIVNGWKEYSEEYHKDEDGSREVFGVTDQFGRIEFHLDEGTYSFYFFREEYYELHTLFDVSANMEETIIITPYPPESSIVKGMVLDSETNLAVENVILSFMMVDWKEFQDPDDGWEDDEWEDDEWEDGGEGEEGMSSPSEDTDIYFPYTFNQTYTDELGWYLINLIPGTYYVDVFMDRYLGDNTMEDREFEGDAPIGEEIEPDGTNIEYYSQNQKITVNENETLWLNISLKPLPPKDATVKGFLKDESGAPVTNAQIYIHPQFHDRTEASEPPMPGNSEKYRGDEDHGESDVPDVDFGEPDYLYENYYGTSDRDGLYEIELREGNYTMQVYPAYNMEWDMKESQGLGNSMGSEEIVYDETRRDMEEEYSTMEIEPKQEQHTKEVVEFNFHINKKSTLWHNITFPSPLPRDSRIHGVVMDRDTGEPLTNAQINIYGGEIFFSFHGEVDDQGEFDIDVYPGYYYVNAYTSHDRYMEPDEYFEFEAEYGEDGMGMETEPGGMYRITTTYFPYSTELYVESGDSLELVILLEPQPDDDVKIEGFIRSEVDETPLSYFPLKTISITEELVVDNYTYSDETGHYEIYVPLGDLIITAGEMKDLGWRNDLGYDDLDGDYNDGYETKPGGDKYFFPKKVSKFLDTPGDLNLNFDLEQMSIPEEDTFVAKVVGSEGMGHMYIFDIERGLGYEQYYWGKYQEREEYTSDDMVMVDTLEVDDATREGTFTEISMALPDGNYKGFLSENGEDLTTRTSEMFSFKISMGEKVTMDISLKSDKPNHASMKLTFISEYEIQISADISLGSEAMMLKATIESEIGDGDMVITTEERKLIEKYVSLEENPLIRPVISISGMPFLLEPDSLTYEIDENVEGAIDESKLDIAMRLKMNAVRGFEFDEEGGLLMDLKGPYPMNVDCEIELPVGMELSDGTRTITATITIDPSIIWDKGLSGDFDEQCEKGGIDDGAYASAPENAEEQTGMFSSDELSGNDGLQLQVYRSDSNSKSGNIAIEKGNLFYLSLGLLLFLGIMVLVINLRKRNR